MHTFRSSFRQFNEPLLSGATTTSDTPETAPIVDASPTSSTEAQASTTMSFRTKKTSPTTTTTANAGTKSSNTSATVKSLSLSPSSFLRRKKEKIAIIKLDPVTTPEGLSNDTTTTIPGISTKGKGKAGSVNPNKGIMALNNEDDVALLPKRSDSMKSSTAPSSPQSSSIRDSLFRIRSPSMKKKVVHAATTKAVDATAVATSMSMIDDTLDAPAEDDPVLALYTTRNTQKVRFSLGEVEPKERTYSSHDGNGSSAMASSPSKDGSGRNSKRTSGSVDTKFNIKKFMRGALFGGSGTGSNKKSSNEEFELEFEREMEEATK